MKLKSKHSRIEMFRTFSLIIIVMIVWYVLVLLFIHQAEPQIYDDNILKVPVLNWCKTLSFQVPPSKNTLALVSSPGSGNTWFRYLLQQATGIYTGSVYMDYALRVNGFPAEGVRNGSVLVVKTHEEPPLEPWKFTSAILLIRNPRDAILADFNRLHKGHTGLAPKVAFKTKTLVKNVTVVGPSGKNYTAAKYLDWKTFVPARLNKWERMHTTWLVKFRGPMLIVSYEELVLDLRKTLQKVLDFLSFKYTESDLACALKKREGIYQRKRKYKDFDPYTTEMSQAIDQAKMRVHETMFHYRRKTVK